MEEVTLYARPGESFTLDSLIESSRILENLKTLNLSNARFSDVAREKAMQGPGFPNLSTLTMSRSVRERSKRTSRCYLYSPLNRSIAYGRCASLMMQDTAFSKKDILRMHLLLLSMLSSLTDFAHCTFTDQSWLTTSLNGLFPTIPALSRSALLGSFPGVQRVRGKTSYPEHQLHSTPLSLNTSFHCTLTQAEVFMEQRKCLIGLDRTSPDSSR